MRAVDTNILVRLIAQDEPAQVLVAENILADGEVLILPTVLLETEWVLRSSYRFSRERIAAALTTLCGLDGVHVVSEPAMIAVVARYAEAGDFADLMHVALADEQEVTAFVTFDRELAAADVSGLPIAVV